MPGTDESVAAPQPRPAAAPTAAAPGTASQIAVAPQKGILRRDAVRVVSQPALVDCGGAAHGATLTVIPLMDGDRVAGLEVRCGCGASTLIECIYQTENSR